MPDVGERSELVQPAPSANIVIWEGDSGPYHVRWSRDDLVALRRGEPAVEVLSVKAEIRSNFDAQVASMRDMRAHEEAASGSQAEPAATPGACERESHVRLLSLVGSLLSYQEGWNLTCPVMAHPADETVYRTYDLDTRKYVSLDDVFPQGELFAALSADKLVRAALARSSAKPEDLPALVSVLASGEGVLTDELCFYWPGDLLRRFAFHHTAADRVAVRIGLPGGGPCRPNLTQLGIVLSLPTTLRHALDEAGTARDGALPRVLEKRAELGETVVSFRAVL